MNFKLATFAALPLALAVSTSSANPLADQLSALANAKASSGKLGSVLATMQQEANAIAPLAAKKERMNALTQMSGALSANDKVTVDIAIRGDKDAFKAQLEAMGATNISMFGNMASAMVPMSALGQLGLNSQVQFARHVQAEVNVGVVTSQADAAFRSDVARDLFRVAGEGMRIGVLSDSFGCNPPPRLAGTPNSSAAEDVVNGDLPADVIVLDDTACPASDEGRAMLQLIYDVAPKSALAFHTAFGGQAGFASGIVELATDAGSDVIVDDVIFFAEPMFQDGIIAQAVDTVNALGVPYFSSAGNRARDSYEDDYRPVDIGNGLRAHDFDPGPGVDIFQDVQVITADFGQITPSFQWDEPNFSVSGAPGSASDLDMLFFNTDGSLVLDCFADRDINVFPDTNGFPPICQFGSTNNTGGDAIEIVSIVSFIGTVTVQAAFIQSEGPAPTRVKYVPFSRSGAFDIVEFDTQSGTSFGHNNAAGGMGVGAAPFSTTAAFNDRDFGGACLPACAEPFSSAGGLAIRIDTQGNRLATPDNRMKPDVTGPDGTNTSFFGTDSIIDDDDGDGLLSPAFDGENPEDEFPNFFGTSAAAPNVAAVAALMLQASEPGRVKLNDGTLNRICQDGNTRLVTDSQLDRLLNGPGGEDREVSLGFCLTTDDVYSTLENTALDMTRRVVNRFAGTFEEFPGNAEGFDFDSGFGFVDAVSAIDAVAADDDDDDDDD